MKGLVRSTTGEILRNFLLAFVLMTASLLFEKLYRVIKAVPDLPFSLMGKLLVLLAPSFFPMGVPMALLVAILLTYGRMTMDGELLALRSLGAKPGKLAVPAVGFALACTVFTLVSAMFIAPESRRVFRETMIAAIPEAVRVDEGVITEAFPGTVLFVGEKQSERQFRRLFIFREQDAGLPAVAIAAEEGTLVFDKETRDLRLALRNGQVHRADARTDVLLRFGSYDLNLGAPTVRAGRKREEMRLAALRAGARDPSLGQQERLRLGVEFQRRFAWPVACLVFCFIGVSLGSLTGKSGRLGGFFAALAVLFGYYYSLILAEEMVLSGGLGVALGVWAPNVLGGLFAAILFLRRGGIR